MNAMTPDLVTIPASDLRVGDRITRNSTYRWQSLVRPVRDFTIVEPTGARDIYGKPIPGRVEVEFGGGEADLYWDANPSAIELVIARRDDAEQPNA